MFFITSMTAVVSGILLLLLQMDLVDLRGGGGSSVSNNLKTGVIGDDGRRRPLPSMIIHVGPSKTGTTYIQQRFSKSEDLLGLDGYRYIGNDHGVLHVDTTKRPVRIGDDLRELLCGRSETYPAGGGGRNTTTTTTTNLIGSSEWLAQYSKPNGILRQWSDYAGAVGSGCGDDAGPHWDVEIVITYRRYYEVQPSHYHQQYKTSRTNGTVTTGHRFWPGEHGGIRIPTLPEYLENKDLEYDDRDTPWMRVKHNYQNWGRSFPVSLFLFHQEGDLFTNFVCDILRPESSSCRGLLTKEEPDDPSSDDSSAADAEEEERERKKIGNVSTRYTDHDILAVRAWEEGLVHPNDDRMSVTRAVWKRWQALEDARQLRRREQLRGDDDDSAAAVEDDDPFPMVCPDDDLLREIRDRALEAETWVMSTIEEDANRTTDGRQRAGAAPAPTPPKVTDFEDGWKAAIDGQKFCSIDAPRALKLDVWRDFFAARRRRIKNHPPPPLP